MSRDGSASRCSMLTIQYNMGGAASCFCMHSLVLHAQLCVAACTHSFTLEEGAQHSDSAVVAIYRGYCPYSD